LKRGHDPHGSLQQLATRMGAVTQPGSSQLACLLRIDQTGAASEEGPVTSITTSVAR
jgi:hypothetical protein